LATGVIAKTARPASTKPYPRLIKSDALSRDGFDRMLELMRDTRANWIACVPLEACEQDRAEVAEGNGELIGTLSGMPDVDPVPPFGSQGPRLLSARGNRGTSSAWRREVAGTRQ
jgi:hypothetical protein